MAASYEQSCRIRVTSHLAAVLLLLLFVLNCRRLGDWCKRRWCNFSNFRKKEVSPLPPPKIQEPRKRARTHTHTHTRTHARTHTQINTYTHTDSQCGRSIFCVFFSKTIVCGLLKSSQQLFIIYYCFFFFLLFMIRIYPHTVFA